MPTTQVELLNDKGTKKTYSGGNLKIDEGKCRGCGACVKSTGGKVIRLENYKARVFGNGMVENPEIIAAGCPGRAISVIEFPDRPHVSSNPAELLQSYFAKMKGVSSSPARVDGFEILCSWIGAFLGISAVSYINFNLLAQSDMLMLIGSFGASAVLIYGAISSPLAPNQETLSGAISYPPS